MEFKAHLSGLDGVGGTISLHCLGWGPTPYALSQTPGLTSVVWDGGDRITEGTPEEILAENQRQEAVIQQAAAQFVDSAGNLAFVYDAEADDHLRIYGLPHVPPEEARRYLANRPPTGLHWGTLSLSYDIVCDHDDRGFKDSKVYVDQNGVPQYGLKFTHAGTTVEGRSALSITEQAFWVANDGSEVFATGAPSKPPKILFTDSQAWIDYLEACRAIIHRNYKLWVPKALVAIGETEETEGDAALLESRMIASEWLDGPVGEAMDFYVKNGDPRPLIAALAADETAWLDEVVPDGVVPGLASGKTVREMILEGLR